MNIICPNCGKVILIRKTIYSIGYYCKCKCGYNVDRGTIRNQLNTLKKRCSYCGNAITLRISKKDKCFFGCIRYPSCHFSTDLYGAEKLEERFESNDPRFYKGDTCVYVVKSGDYLKIGRSSNIRERFKQLRTMTPLGLDNKAYIKIENKDINEDVLHKKFSKYRVNGEWFSYSLEIVLYIKKNEFEKIFIPKFPSILPEQIGPESS